MLLFPCHLSITWYLAFLAADWSGLSVPLHFNFSLVAPWSLRPSPNSPGHSLIGTEGVTFLVSPFLSWFSPLFPWCCCALALRVPFLFLVLLCLSSFFSCSFPLLLSLLAVYWSGWSVLLLFLLSLLSLCFLYPSGVVPGLSGRRLVRISSATLISSFPSSCTFLIPVLIALRNRSFSVVPLAADWSGVSLCWPLSFTIPPFETKHCLRPQTGAGLCFSPQTHGTPHKTASRADMV